MNTDNDDDQDIEREIDNNTRLAQNVKLELGQSAPRKTHTPKEGKLKVLVNDKPTLPFNILVIFFVRYAQKTRGANKQKLVKTFIDKIFSISRNPIYSYTFLRLIIPFQDRERGVYKVQEKGLAKLFHQVLGLSDKDYQRMVNYKHANLQPYGAPVGDFPSVVEHVINGLCETQGKLTIGQVDDLLDELVSAQDTKAQQLVITKLLQSCTSIEIMWIIRIILKDLKIGLKYEKILQLYHPDAAEYYNNTSSLKEVCKEFVDPNKTIKNMFRLFNPIKPMLAGKKNLEELKLLIQDKQFLIETKFDGERIQCHFTPDQIRLYTRNSNDYTHIYIEKLQPVLREALQIHTAILDGEVVVVSKDDNKPVGFGINKTVAKDVNDDTYQLCYYIFDLLYVKGLNGEEQNMMQHKLESRKKVLQKIIKSIPGRLELVEGIQVRDFPHLCNEFDLAIMNNAEGIILKSLDVEYFPNDRSTKWIKLKGDYVENMTDTCDLIIIGGYYGTDSHRVEKFDQYDRISHFLVGVAVRIDKDQPKNSIILPFTKVGTGYNDNELSSLRNKLRNNWTNKKPLFIPSNWNPGVNDRPDIYIDNPKDSIILELKAAEITPSNTFPTDYTLRFPRVEKIRWNKNWDEVMTTEDLKQMVNSNKYTKNMKKKNDDDADSQDEKNSEQEKPALKVKQKKGGKARQRGANDVHVMKQFRGIDPNSVEKQTELFVGLEFYIVNNGEKYDKDYLESLVYQQNGTCVENYIESVTYVIAADIDIRVKALNDQVTAIVVKPDWIIECVRRQLLLELSPRFLLCCPKFYWDRVKLKFDQYGDSYSQDIDEQTLLCLMNDIPNLELPNEHLDKMEKYIEKCKVVWRFKNKIFYFYKYAHQEGDIELTSIRCQMKGAQIVQDWDQQFTHLVIFPNQSHIQELRVEKFLVKRKEIKIAYYEKILEILNE